MTLALSSPVTGGAQVGLTSPTYTLTTDVAPTVNGRQYAVTALGGTQTNVRTHAVSDPFTVTLTRASVLKPLPGANPITGKYGSIPKNTHTIVVRKGCNFAANQAPDVATARVYLDIPAGTDSYDAINLRAMCSLLAGIFAQISSGIGDTVATGIP